MREGSTPLVPATHQEGQGWSREGGRNHTALRSHTTAFPPPVGERGTSPARCRRSAVCSLASACLRPSPSKYGGYRRGAGLRYLRGRCSPAAPAPPARNQEEAANRTDPPPPKARGERESVIMLGAGSAVPPGEDAGRIASLGTEFATARRVLTTCLPCPPSCSSPSRRARCGPVTCPHGSA